MVKLETLIDSWHGSTSLEVNIWKQFKDGGYTNLYNGTIDNIPEYFMKRIVVSVIPVGNLVSIQLMR